MRSRKIVKLILYLCIINFWQIFMVKSDKTCNNAEIVIIGAGPSGIAASSKLFENGFCNVTILEAEDRIGGRVYTAGFGNQILNIIFTFEL